jgi:hypothetical protein
MRNARPCGRSTRDCWSVLASFCVTLALVACGSDAAGPHPPPPPPPPPAPHRVGVRTNGSRGEFFDRTTGAVFVPRGANYVKLASQIGWTNNTFTYHSTFNVGQYDATAAEAMLVQMSHDGFNVVRVFLNGCCEVNTLGNPAGGLSTAYLANLANFLTRAKSHGVLVLLTTDGIPMFGGYENVLYESCCSLFDADNMNTLTHQGLTAHAMMWRDIITGLKAQGAPLDAIFAYELLSELSYDTRYPPLSLASGSVPTGDGQSYDMSSASARQAMMDDNMVYWSSHLRDTIVALDPSALVTVGFFEPQGPNPSRAGDPRLTRPYPAIAQSSIDFVDLHPYAGVQLTIDQYAQNFGEEAYPAKPVIMGEFGAPSLSFGSAGAAAQALVAWQTGSCPHNFAGWIMWTWDTAAQPDGSFWAMTSADSVIEKSLAPARRADPCSA